jgi:hypothetical protein
MPKICVIQVQDRVWEAEALHLKAINVTRQGVEPKPVRISTREHAVRLSERGDQDGRLCLTFVGLISVPLKVTVRAEARGLRLEAQRCHRIFG